MIKNRDKKEKLKLICIGGAHQGLGGAKPPPQIFHEIYGCVLKKVSQQSLKR